MSSDDPDPPRRAVAIEALKLVWERVRGPLKLALNLVVITIGSLLIVFAIAEFTACIADRLLSVAGASARWILVTVPGEVWAVLGGVMWGAVLVKLGKLVVDVGKSELLEPARNRVKRRDDE